MVAFRVLWDMSLQALAVAQSPWLAAGSSRGALKKIEELLTARTDLRITGALLLKAARLRFRHESCWVSFLSA
jgi:hypothetical protein